MRHHFDLARIALITCQAFLLKALTKIQVLEHLSYKIPFDHVMKMLIVSMAEYVLQLPFNDTKKMSIKTTIRSPVVELRERLLFFSCNEKRLPPSIVFFFAVKATVKY